MASKILFHLERDSHGYPPAEIESLWANAIGEGYELDSIPFYAKRVALGDVVVAEPDLDGALIFKSVLRRGGHSTYRLFLLKPRGGDPQTTIGELHAFGMNVEYDLPSLLAIDIPPSVPLEAAESMLFQGVDNGRWELEEGYRAGDP